MLRGMGFLAWAKRLDDAAEARAERRAGPFRNVTRNWSPVQAATAAFLVTTATMLVVYVGLRLAGLSASPFMLAPPILAATAGAAVGNSIQRGRRG